MNTHITAIKTTLPNSRKKKKKDILPSYQTTQTSHKREESVRRKREWVSATRTGLRNCSVLNELKPTSPLALSAREEEEETHDHTNKRGNYGAVEKETC